MRVWKKSLGKYHDSEQTPWNRIETDTQKQLQESIRPQYERQYSSLFATSAGSARFTNTGAGDRSSRGKKTKQIWGGFGRHQYVQWAQNNRCCYKEFRVFVRTRY